MIESILVRKILEELEKNRERYQTGLIKTRKSNAMGRAGDDAVGYAEGLLNGIDDAIQIIKSIKVS